MKNQRFIYITKLFSDIIAYLDKYKLQKQSYIICRWENINYDIIPKMLEINTIFIFVQ